MNNSRGFSIVEVMVTGGLLAGVGLAGSSFLRNNMKQENAVKFRVDITNFTEEVRSLLSSETACLNSFGGKTAKIGVAESVTNLLDGSVPSGVVKYSTDSNYGDGSIKLKSLTLKDFVEGDSASKGIMTLHLGLDNRKESLGVKELIQKINIAVEMDAAKKIVKCIALAKMSDGIWRKASTNLSNIYYTNGKVGIGTNNPASALNVVPRIDIHSMPLATSVPRIGMNRLMAPADNKKIEFGIDPNGSFYFQFIRDDNSGGGDVVMLYRKNENVAHMALGNHVAGKQLLITMYPHDFTNLANAGDMGIVSRESTDTNSPAIFIGPKKNAASGGGIRITSTGLVGIGVKDPSYLLQLASDSAAKPGTGTWTIASDERLKDVHGPFNRGLESILGLNPIYFNYKNNNSLRLPSDKTFVGIRAQEALKSVPEAVKRDKEGYLHINTDAITWATVNALKELNDQHMKLKTENQQIKTYLCGKEPDAPFCK